MHQLLWVNEGLNKLPIGSGRMDQQKNVGVISYQAKFSKKEKMSHSRFAMRDAA